MTMRLCGRGRVRRCMYRLSPALYLLLMVWLVQWLKYIPRDSGTKGTTLLINSGSDHAVTDWLIVSTPHSSDCFPLAAHFPNWLILITGVVEKRAKHSRCHFLDDSDLIQICSKLNSMQCNNPLPSHIIPLIISVYLSEQLPQPSLVYIPPPQIPPRDILRPRPPSLSGKGLMYSSDQSVGHSITILHAHMGCNRTGGQHGPVEQSWSGMHYFLCAGSHPPPVASLSPLLTDASCDPLSPPLALPPTVYTPTTTHGALISSTGLWILGLSSWPSMTPSVPLSLGLSAITQRLVHLTAGYVKVTPQFYQTHNSNLKSDLISKMHDRSSQLERFTTYVERAEAVSCHEMTFTQCLVSLVSEVLVDTELLKDLPDLIPQWLQLLEQSGYTLPTITRSHGPMTSQGTCSDVSYSPVDYTNSIAESKTWRKVKAPINNMAAMQVLYDKQCAGIKEKNRVNLSLPWTQFTDILLIVVFNKPHYEALRWVELLYQPLFPRILYCGPEWPDRQRFAHLYGRDGRIHNRSFIVYGSTPDGHFPGSFNYRCLMLVTQLDLPVSGYLVISDDTLLWPHTLTKLSQDTVWFLPKKQVRVGDLVSVRECRLGMCDFHPHWNWWADYRSATIEALSSLAESENLIERRCHSTLRASTGAELRAYGAFSDVYYIPSRLAGEFSILAEVFLKYKVFLEIAVPTILGCIEDNWEEISGTIVWSIDNRDKPWQYFTVKELLGKSFMHPCKWGFMSNISMVKDYSNFLCDRILPFIHDPYGRVT